MRPLRHRVTPSEAAGIVDMRLAGMLVKVISYKIGVSQWAVKNVLRQNGLAPRSYRPVRQLAANNLFTRMVIQERCEHALVRVRANTMRRD